MHSFNRLVLILSFPMVVRHAFANLPFTGVFDRTEYERAERRSNARRTKLYAPRHDLVGKPAVQRLQRGFSVMPCSV
jgi:hypothetical protein